jgi:hypothetical protein
MKSDELVPTIIDLEKVKENQLNESFLVSFGAEIESMLRVMMGASPIPYKVTGNSADLASLAAVLGKEKRYMNSYLKHGLNDPRVVRNRYRLENAVYNFEKDTGIKWPLK